MGLLRGSLFLGLLQTKLTRRLQEQTPALVFHMDRIQVFYDLPLAAQVTFLNLGDVLSRLRILRRLDHEDPPSLRPTSDSGTDSCPRIPAE